MRPEIIIVDCSTGIETIREMNDEELAQYEKDKAAQSKPEGE